jgi:hypothetical protein
MPKITKATTKQKGNKEVVTAAKEVATVALQGPKLASSNAANDIPLEDLYLCKAYVSVSTDPITGTGQKASDFWEKVAAKFREIKDTNTESEVIVEHNRDADSLVHMFQRQIQKQVNTFNKFYVEQKIPLKSGWTEEMYIEAAAETFGEVHDSPFRFKECIAVVHQMPKFNPMVASNMESDEVEGNDDDDDNETEPQKHNKIGQVMGDRLMRPSGSKKAKKLKADSMSQASLASSRMEAMKDLTASNNRIADVMETSRKHEL